ncbi:hypothetical protein FA13DRAFT_1744482 [Coprinellus micaceus]|uniref:C3H1-type domain-containing protein n=1 Tax=Coprinellus micaceus TaxID=71717 RepID=A0A4Y7SCT2_COPMI|nr:hypothetical protein FA13DRAFT_1744482 [Coprinellus micaceus]
MSKTRILPTATAGGTTSVPPPVAKSLGECMFFAAGLCRKGAQCPYLHPPTTRNKNESKGDKQNNAHPSTPDNATEDKGPASPLQKGPKPQGKRNHRAFKRQEAGFPDNPTRQHGPRPGQASVHQPPNQGPNGKKHTQVKAEPCLQWARAGKCKRGEACWYTHDAKGDGEAEKDKASSSTNEGLPKPDRNAKNQTNPLRGTKQPCSAWAKGSCKRGNGCPYEHGGKVIPSKQGQTPRTKSAGKKKRGTPATHKYAHAREAMPEAPPLSSEDAVLLQAYEEEDQKAYIWALKHEWGFR